MEKDLLVVLVIIVVVLLIIAVVYRSFTLFFDKSEARRKRVNLDDPVLLEQTKAIEEKKKYDREYRELIEKSKSELKNFMEKQNAAQ